MAVHGFNDSAWERHKEDHKFLRGGKRQTRQLKAFERKGSASGGGGGSPIIYLILTGSAGGMTKDPSANKWTPGVTTGVQLVFDPEETPSGKWIEGESVDVSMAGMDGVAITAGFAALAMAQAVAGSPLPLVFWVDCVEFEYS